MLSGGLDAVLTTDPKVRSEVDADVDVPYAQDDVLSAGALQLGPDFKPLLGWSSQMTVLRSVFMGVANHPAGMRQMFRLRNGAVEEMPGVLDIVGSHRDTQALPSVTLHPGSSYAPSAIGDAVLAKLSSSRPEELQLLARVMRRESARMGGRGAEAAARTSLEDCATFLDRAAITPPFTRNGSWPSVASATTKSTKAFAEDLQRVIWLLEHDLSRCALVIASDWDTHNDNRLGQRMASSASLSVVADFLSEMRKRKNAHGALLDNTLIVMGSELGRFPVLNRSSGKDHFPEAPLVFFGAVGGKGTAFGRTGSRMQGLPLEKSTGRPLASGSKASLTDVGTTILRTFGIDPTTSGYDGETLEFLRSA